MTIPFDFHEGQLVRVSITNKIPPPPFMRMDIEGKMIGWNYLDPGPVSGMVLKVCHSNRITGTFMDILVGENIYRLYYGDLIDKLFAIEDLKEE